MDSNALIFNNVPRPEVDDKDLPPKSLILSGFFFQVFARWCVLIQYGEVLCCFTVWTATMALGLLVSSVFSP